MAAYYVKFTFQNIRSAVLRIIIIGVSNNKVFDLIFHVYLGPPGCGKRTQCAKIVEKYGCAHLSASELVRRELSKLVDVNFDGIMKEIDCIPQVIMILMGS